MVIFLQKTLEKNILDHKCTDYQAILSPIIKIYIFIEKKFLYLRSQKNYNTKNIRKWIN
jgi:hypothetical protein